MSGDELMVRLDEMIMQSREQDILDLLAKEYPRLRSTLTPEQQSEISSIAESAAMAVDLQQAQELASGHLAEIERRA